MSGWVEFLSPGHTHNNSISPSLKNCKMLILYDTHLCQPGQYIIFVCFTHFSLPLHVILGVGIQTLHGYLFELRFTSQSTAMVMLSRSAHLTTLFSWASLTIKAVIQYFVHTLSLVTDTNPSRINARKENDSSNYFMINLQESMGPVPDWTRYPVICSWTSYRLHYWAGYASMLKFVHIALVLQISFSFNIWKMANNNCLFVWFITTQSTSFQLYRHGSSWVEPVLSKDKCVLLKNTTQWRRWGSNPLPLGKQQLWHSKKEFQAILMFVYYFLHYLMN